MKNFKTLLVSIVVLLSFKSYSQAIKYYDSDYSIKVKMDKYQSTDGGEYQGALQENIRLIHDKSKSTLQIILSDYDKVVHLFKNVEYHEIFYNDGNKYIAYTANKDGMPYFISFGKNLIKIDNRVKKSVIAFHLKN
ncbi:hypothetical protein LCM02_12335 [Lutimonas saemankumensis]|uniref:hypothetical protein n=1 Tax=Lutimonas saemankumensis TaxID=483016 RepID=UPI001CD5223A|nr:hypothetical protein [Lutimonas saemankumensis]MCA0933242.1 hypothetical protein [Lutimonas saemankumensis]